VRLRTAVLALLALACTRSVPAPTPVVIPLTVGRTSARDTVANGRGAAKPPPTRTQSPPTVLPSRRAPAGIKDAGDATIRVLLSASLAAMRIASPGGLVLRAADGSLLAKTAHDETWRVEWQRGGGRIRAVRPDGVGTVWVEPPLIAHSPDGALLSIAGKPYRGDLDFYGGDSGVVVVNVVKIDEYLKGVVPMEIGTRAEGDSAAVQAQAITARSYAYTRLTRDPSRTYDLAAGVLDQVYGGAAVETPVSSQAVESTRTLVLKYAGRVVNAPYSSTCGGETAAASEVWRSGDEPYLQRVSDRIPGTDRYYCDISPRFAWTRTIDGAALNAALAQYLAAYTSVPNRTPGSAHDVAVASRTPSGRVGRVTITTDRGNFSLRGNDIRYVLRPPGGEILNSTNFSMESTHTSGGSIGHLTIRGNGYGHGVGMCQWGAIGRARAGEDVGTILHTYYPGTTIGPAE
jgi:stage II sporulation protein D